MTTPKRTDARTRRERGFSIAELLVASALVLLIVAAVVALAVPATEAAHTQPEATDLHQRARVAAAALFRDLHMAGAGVDRGSRAGPLSGAFAAVVPRRIGAEFPDPPGTARSDAISIVWVPATAVQTTVVAPFSTTPLVVRQEPGCPMTRPACGAEAGMGLVVFDATGTFQLLTVEAVSDAGAVVRPRGAPPNQVYGDDAIVAEVEARTYYVDPNTRQLRQYDTDRTDVPVMDDVVEMSVEYFGSPVPPTSPRPPPGVSNCLYDAGGSLMSGLVILPVDQDGLASLPLDLFRDGPWCGSGNTQYDADLLRIRRVRVRMRLQVASPALRGADGRFAEAGTSRGATRAVPDLRVAFDVAPRNLIARR